MFVLIGAHGGCFHSQVSDVHGSLPAKCRIGSERYFVGVACFAVECFTEWLLLSRAAPSVDHHFKMSSTCGSSFFACKSNCHASALLCPWFFRCLVPSCSPWACLVPGCSHFCRLVARRSVSASVPTLVIFKALESWNFSSLAASQNS